MSAPKITIGNVEIIALVDTPFDLPWEIFFPGINVSEFEAFQELYPASFGQAAFHTQAGCYAIRSQGQTVLCDTGIGPGPIQFLGGIRGRLLDDMRDKGIPPEDVDTVVFTHLHGDHVGWNLSADGKPNFPKARFLVPKEDWEFFSKMANTNPQMQQITPLQDLGLMELISGETMITSEVAMYPTPGHTPGHTSLLISSNGQRSIVTGDLAHHPAQVDHIEWCSAFDTNHGTTSQTRRTVFDQVEADGLIAAFCHFPDPFGKLVRAEGKRIFQAV